MDDLISKQSVIAMAKDIRVNTDKGNVYRHRCIDPTAIMELQPVEAIPVWWLKEFENKLCALGAKETANTIELILAQWRGEHD